MEITRILTSTLPGLLILVMLGIGLTIDFVDLKAVLSKPRAISIGLLCQAAVLPAIAFAICFLVSLPPEFKVGLILLAASPGGPSSNIYSLLAGGDVALNLTLTAINSFTNLVTMPFYVALALKLFATGAGPAAQIPAGKFEELFVLVVVPAVIGVFLRSRRPEWATKCANVIKLISILVLTLTVSGLVYANWTVLLANSKSFGEVIVVFNVVSLGIAYGFARLARLNRRAAIAIGFEAGIHNASLALFLAVNVLQNQKYAIPATMYSVLMYFTAGALCAWFRRQNAVLARG